MRRAHKVFCQTLSAGDDKFHSLHLLSLNPEPEFSFETGSLKTSSLCIHSLFSEVAEMKYVKKDANLYLVLILGNK